MDRAHTFRVIVDLVVMAMKKCFTLSRGPELEVAQSVVVVQYTNYFSAEG